MQIYWSLKRVPEMAGLSHTERCQVHRACGRAFVGSVQCYIAVIVCGFCGMAGAVGGHYIHLAFGIPYSIWQVAVGCGIGGGVGGTVYCEFMLHYLRPFYADYIKSELRHDAQND